VTENPLLSHNVIDPCEFIGINLYYILQLKMQVFVSMFV